MSKEETIARVKQMVGIITPNLEVDAGTAAINEKEKGASYVACLPEDLPLATVKQVHNHDNEFAAAAVQAIGNLAIEHMAKNPTTEKMIGKVRGESSSDSISATVNQQRVFRDSLTDPAQPKEVIKFGFTSVKVSTGADRGAAITQVLSDIAENAVAKFKK